VRYLPIQLDLVGREALVVLATSLPPTDELVAKVDRLISAGARVTLLHRGDPGALASRSISIEARAVEDRDLDHKAITYVTNDDPALAERLHARALATSTLLSVVDRPERSTFASTAVIEANGLTISIASGGVAPGLLRRVREDLEALFADPRLGAFVDGLRQLRDALPRGERASRLSEAVRGFRIEARLHFPERPS
jgi:precorrin-2 dehydrogenase/sirohydrochlorin ferrochelatase